VVPCPSNSCRTYREPSVRTGPTPPLHAIPGEAG